MLACIFSWFALYLFSYLVQVLCIFFFWLVPKPCIHTPKHRIKSASSLVFIRAWAIWKSQNEPLQPLVSLSKKESDKTWRQTPPVSITHYIYTLALQSDRYIDPNNNDSHPQTTSNRCSRPNNMQAGWICVGVTRANAHPIWRTSHTVAWCLRYLLHWWCWNKC